MPLIVHTAPSTYKGPDRLETSLKKNLELASNEQPAPGIYFAPSIYLLWGMQKYRRAYAGVLPTDLWEKYARRYKKEMRASYKIYAKEWLGLLTSSEVTILCGCRTPEQCHRSILAEILVKLGATYQGERPRPAHGWGLLPTHSGDILP